MKISKEHEQYNILVSRDELKTLGHCLLEAMENLNEIDFKIRVGRSVSEVEALLEEIIKAYREQ